MDIVTIKENKDFRRIYAKGTSYASGILVTYVIRNRTRDVRIGITTGKKIGNAVTRSRCRRVIRAALHSYRDKLDCVKGGYDVVFVARARTARAIIKYFFIMSLI